MANDCVLPTLVAAAMLDGLFSKARTGRLTGTLIVDREDFKLLSGDHREFVNTGDERVWTKHVVSYGQPQLDLWLTCFPDDEVVDDV